MPKHILEVCAQLDGVKSISVPQDYPWYVFLSCCNCGEKTQKPVVISESEKVEGIRRAVVNLKISCKLCMRVNEVKLLPADHKYTADQSPEWAPFLEMECRGIEPVQVLLADDVPLDIVGLEGFEFEDAFIADGEFYTYDEKLKTEASVTEFKSRIVKR